MHGVLLCYSARQAHRGASRARVLLCKSVCQALQGAPWVRRYSTVWHISHLKGTLDGLLLCSSAHQVFDGPASPLFSCQWWSVEREAMVMAAAPTSDSAISLASMAAWLSSTGMSHHNLPPPIPSIRLSVVNSNPYPGCSTVPRLHLPAAEPSRGLHPCLGYVWLWQGLSDSHST